MSRTEQALFASANEAATDLNRVLGLPKRRFRKAIQRWALRVNESPVLAESREPMATLLTETAEDLAARYQPSWWIRLTDQESPIYGPDAALREAQRCQAGIAAFDGPRHNNSLQQTSRKAAGS